MPLYKTFNAVSKSKIFVWKIDEELSFLENIHLNENSKNRVSKMKSEIHKKGFLSVRHLLAHLGYTDDDLYYNQNGKPLLKDGTHISITHSFNFSAIIVSKSTVVGIDIEKNRDKIINISDKFLSAEKREKMDSLFGAATHKHDLEFMQTESKKELIQELTVIWGAKESLYKTHPKGNLSFKKHIRIQDITRGRKILKGWIKKKRYDEEFRVRFHHFDGFTLVYATDQKDFYSQYKHYKLRKLKKKDAGAFSKLANNKKIWQNLRDSFPHPYTLKDAENFIKFTKKTKTSNIFAITNKGEIVGAIGLHLLPDINKHTAELGYWIGEPHWGLKIATRAVQLVIKHGFKNMDINRIYASTLQGNLGSTRVLEKNNFVFEGKSSKSAFKDGQFYDEYRFELLKENYLGYIIRN